MAEVGNAFSLGDADLDVIVRNLQGFDHGDQGALLNDLDALEEVVSEELKVREEKFPSKDFVPNIAQMRFFEAYRGRHRELGDYPHIALFRSGNGVGKTCSAGIMFTGLSLGKQALDLQYLNLGFFDEIQELRKKRPLKVRLVGDGADMKEQGSLYQQIQKWCPTAKFSGKEGDYYTKVTVKAPEPGYHDTVWDFKTHKQDVTSHAGPDLDVVIFNEPPPGKIYTENATRTRLGGITGKSGYQMMFLTPLLMEPYLHKLEMGNHKPGVMHVVEGSIWDNCADIPGTRGHLSRDKIEEQIREWEANNPLEVPARVFGKYMFLAGAVFQIYNRDVHLIPPVAVNPDWNVYMIMDPHESKPPFVVWIAVDPLNQCYVIAEYPTEPWDTISSTVKTVKHFVSDCEQIERGRHPLFPYMTDLSVVERIGDPNLMRARRAATGLTIKNEYEECSGWEFNVDIPDDVMLRHNAVRELLHYDIRQKVEAPNLPKLFVFNTCSNVHRAFGSYAYRTNQGAGEGISNKLEPMWGCPMDCVGYFAVGREAWRKVRGRQNSIQESTFSNEIRRGQSAEYYDPNMVDFFGEGAYDGERVA
jgi:phage terminase large subunit-like protein